MPHKKKLANRIKSDKSEDPQISGSVDRWIGGSDNQEVSKSKNPDTPKNRDSETPISSDLSDTPISPISSDVSGLSESESLRQSLKEEYLQKSERVNSVNSKLAKDEEEPETPIKEKPQKTGFFRDRELSFKTFFISQLIVLVLSLAFLGGMYYILYSHNSRMGAADYNPVSREPTSFDLEINSPDDNSLVFDSSVVISGKTSPDSAVLISNEDDNSAVQSDNEGNFAKVINLTPGANPITITAYDNQGDIKQIQRSIYYSDTSLEEEKDDE